MHSSGRKETSEADVRTCILRTFHGSPRPPPPLLPLPPLRSTSGDGRGGEPVRGCHQKGRSCSSKHWTQPSFIAMSTASSVAFCSASSIASFSSSLLASYSFLVSSSALAVRKERVEASTASPDAPPVPAGRGVGWTSPTERRTVRSLRCGPAASPQGGVFCPCGASYVACTTSSLALAPVFCPRRAAFGCALWCAAAARTMTTLSCSCRQALRSRRSLLPASQRRCHRVQLASTAGVLVKGAHTDRALSRKAAGGGGGVVFVCVVVWCVFFGGWEVE